MSETLHTYMESDIRLSYEMTPKTDLQPRFMGMYHD